MMKSIKKRILGFSNNEKGFTLIEIIAVLVILGILAAVAIPRFTNLQDDARDSAAQAAVAEGMARASQAYASALLQLNGSPLPDGDDVKANMPADATFGDDFTVVTVAATNNITITVSAVQGAPITPVIDTWVSPNP